MTGGAGFVGTNLIKRLLKEGHEVVSIDNYSNGKYENEQDGCVYKLALQLTNNSKNIIKFIYYVYYFILNTHFLTIVNRSASTRIRRETNSTE